MKYVTLGNVHKIHHLECHSYRVYHHKYLTHIVLFKVFSAYHKNIIGMK